ncbi:MAG: hypothetical protein OXL97_11095 [Chloroflexota bacterium]|nr:hypothetical protein [Chloroflexota bacterium]MDE2884953.1 hypothetical protein [Chloroflexota bacterium]
MPGGIDALERYLVCQLAQVTLFPIVEDYIDRWSDAMESGNPLPDTLDLVEAAAAEDVPILTIASVDPYLRQCARTGRVPDPARVMTAIVHGFAEVRFVRDRACRCPARQPLAEARILPSERLAFFDDA